MNIFFSLSFLYHNKYLLGIAILLLLPFTLNSHNTYYKEFLDFAHNPNYNIIFDNDAHQGVSAIRRDIENYKALSPFQRFIRCAFFMLDVVVVTPTVMPLLYTYIDTMCKDNKLQTPTIFITRKKHFLNAAAQKLLVSSGAIVIDQRLLHEVSNQEVEAIIAHEIGHIKYNHVNKIVIINLFSMCVCHKILQYLIPSSNRLPYYGLLFNCSDILSALLINKSFEKEADAFAYKTMHKGEGLIEFFERLQRKENQYTHDFSNICSCIEDNKNKLHVADYLWLKGRYYIEKIQQTINDRYKWLYYNTSYGPHPSHQSRIDAARAHTTEEKIID